MGNRYQKSEELLSQALHSIPLGSQTFSKSLTQYPRGASPYFIERAKGSHCWDVDGNEYVDLVNALCSVNLGHCDPDVTFAVRAQLDKGTIFSLPHPLEMQVANKLVEILPNAQMVRFGKNGSDATSAAVRVARAVTRRDRIAVCGYHGWQDWYIGSTTRNLGVPKAVQELTHKFDFNKIDSLHKLFQKHPGEFAAVMMEPMNTTEPEPGFLQTVKELAHQHGALFVLDETITGFRFSLGGAQELFDVEADLSTYGKGLANGYPVSTIVGPEKYMRTMEDIFFSSTFGGEALSLAAALATLEEMQSKNVMANLYRTGKAVLHGTEKIIQKHQLDEVVQVVGNPTWSFLLFGDSPHYTQWQLKTFFLQEALARGIITVGTHNISFAHTDEDVKYLLTVYDEVFAKMAEVTREKTLERNLRCQVLQPLFKVR